MATNYNYPDPADIEGQAQYRPGAASNIFNVLTGGLAGQITGTTQRGQEAARARQALLQEEFGKRDEQRMLDRQLMINALQQGIAAPEGATLEEKMADFRNKSLRRQIAAGEGMGYGLGQRMGPSQYEAEPAFKIAATQAQNQMAQREAELRQTRALKGPELVDALAGYKITPAPGTPVGQLESMLEMARTKAQSQIPLETSGIRAKAQLKTLQGMGFVESPINVDDMSDAEAVANAEIYGRKQQQTDYFGAFERKGKAEEEAVNNFNLLLSDPNRNQDALKKAYLKLPKDSKIEEYRIAAGVNRPATAKETESLDKYISSIDRSSSLAKSVSDLAGLGEISKVSREDFNGYRSWFRGLENKFGAEDPRLRSINNVVQEFQTLIAERRKDFFGASLTDNELAVANQLFANPNQANFLPRVIELVDSIMSKDEIQRKYERRGIFVDPTTKKDVQDARNQWIETKKQYNFGGMNSPTNGLSSEKMSRYQELKRKQNQ
jgi:hypothetical protein